jgi:hypothetical protein
MIKGTSTIFVFLFFYFVAFGQATAEVKELSLEHLKTFQNNLEKLTSDALTKVEKNALIDVTKKLFTFDAKIQTMGLNKHRSEYDVTEYLRRVTFPINPSVDINITFPEDPVIESVIPIDKPKGEFNTYTEYLVTGKLGQYYEKLVDGVKRYADFTIKEAFVRVSVEYGPNGPYTQIKIFRINADEISKR